MKSSPIEILTNFEIGLSLRESIVLKKNNLLWIEAFNFEADRLRKNLEIEELELHHIGSTSIPNIQAKPILDILLVVPFIDKLDNYKLQFEKLGYECKGEYGIPGRRYFVLHDLGKTKSYVHIHAFSKGNDEIEKHLLFRDYLRKFPKKAKQYESIKLNLLADPLTNRSNYTENKAPFINELLQEAILYRF
jgi:GrpB-like predicted nucleotidyltransferase (UPF0157 family)